MGKFGGYISLHRQILDWEWYQNANTFRLFIHLLLRANFDESLFMGKVIHRGQIVTSLPRLADEIGLTVKEVRVALDHLIRTGEVADESTNQYRIITVVKYDDYQNAADERAGKGQAKGRRRADGRAGKGQHNNNTNNINNANKGIITPTGLDSRLDDFDQFWTEYPKRVSKQNAMKAWKKISPDSELSGKIMDGLRRWKTSDEWYRDDGRFIPYPATWLNGRRWEDEVKRASSKPETPARLPVQSYQQRDYSSEQDEAMDRLMRWKPEG